jgi:hypothetical protein
VDLESDDGGPSHCLSPTPEPPPIDVEALRIDPLRRFIYHFRVAKWPLRQALAAELWADVFNHYCLLDGDSARSYVRLRRELSLKFPLFATFMAATPLLWHKFAMTDYTPSHKVAFAINHVESGYLDVDVFLGSAIPPGFDDRMASYNGSYFQNTRESLRLLATKSRLWRDVRFSANGMLHGRMLHRIMETSIAPSISSFDLVLPPFPLEFMDEPDFIMGPIIFPYSIPAIHTLAIHAFSIPWLSIQPYLCLQSLSLSYVPESMHPTASQFAFILRSTPALHTLSLTGDFMLKQTDAYSYDRFEMSHMSQLHLSSIGPLGEAVLGQFLCSIYMPALHQLRLAYIGEDFLSAIEGAPLVGSVLVLTMVSIDDSDSNDSINSFMSGFDFVEVIDLTLVGPRFFEALYTFPDTCLFLTSLVLGPVDLRSVYTYMTERNLDGYPLQDLTLVHGLGSGDYLSSVDRESLRSIRNLLPTMITIPSLNGFLF